MVSRRRVDRSHVTAPWATSPTAETMRLERMCSEFESPVAYQFWPSSPRAEARGSNPPQCEFKSRDGYARVSQRQRSPAQTRFSGRSNRPWRTNSRAASSEEERVSYKHQVGISKFSPPTNHGPLAQWESRRPISDRQRIETAMDYQQRIKPMGDDHKRGQMDPERKAAW